MVTAWARDLRRRWWWAAGAILSAAMLVLDIVVIVPAANSESSTPVLTVNFGTVAARTNPYAIGVGVSTYGASALGNPAEASAERTLDARQVRIPVGVRGGVVTSSAAGAAHLDVPSLVRLYLSWGYHVLVVIGGRSNDVDVQPGDTATIVKALGFDNGVQYTSSNEPTGQGRSIDQAVTAAKMMLAEGRTLHADFKLWGPVWAYYDQGALTTFAKALGSGLAGLDYHRYGMGGTALSTPDAMAETPRFGKEVATTVAQLKSLGLPARVAVDETNLSYRYDDGAAGGESRFFTAVNTVWLASMCGHVLLSGGSCMPYATQNGALGLTVQADGPNPDARPTSSPMPAYWGVGAWTGASRFAHFNDTLFATHSPSAAVEVYAVNNLAGGENVVVINKGTAPFAAALHLANLASGTYRTFATQPSAPYSPPEASTASAYSLSVPVSMPAMSVTTYVFTPGAAH